MEQPTSKQSFKQWLQKDPQKHNIFFFIYLDQQSKFDTSSLSYQSDFLNKNNHKNSQLEAGQDKGGQEKLIEKAA